MQVIGVIGGIASGKSQVTKMFASLGALRIDADELGHQVLEEPEVKELLTQRWSDDVLSSDGRLDRRAIADRVFGASEANELEFLEQTTHPRIGRRIKQKIADATAANLPAVVVDAAILLKTGWDRMCDHLVFVSVPHKVRLQRALQRGWTAEEFEAREAAQLPLPTKQQQADSTVDNSGTLEETFEQVRELWHRLIDGSSPLSSTH